MRRLCLAFFAAMSFTPWITAAEHTKDSLETVKQKLADKQAVLIDVREQDEWDAGHLKDARLLALSKLRKGVPKDELARALPAGKTIYLHCKAGARCLQAGEILEEAGYEVKPLKPGYDALLKAGFAKAEK